MFVILPDGTTQGLQQHGKRDEGMTHAVMVRIRPEGVPGHSLVWGVAYCCATEAAAHKKARAFLRARPTLADGLPMYEALVLPIQHSFNPYTQDASEAR